ncbi:MAG: NAD(P)H-dependent oxidoreductase [Candidatus Auribacterota bacterium]
MPKGDSTMKKLLHIIATPRGEESRTLKVSSAFIEAVRWNNGHWAFDELNLFTEKLPELGINHLNGKYTLMSGKNITPELQPYWDQVTCHIDRFLSANAYLISTPMWNFGIPYKLKQYIDIIVQPRYLFQYTSSGVEGLAKDRRMVVISSRGGDYSCEPMKSMDTIEPYLKTVFGFVGIRDISFVSVQPMDAMGPDIRNQRIHDAQEQARALAAHF